MPLQAAKEMLGRAERRIKTAAEDILVPALDRFDRASLTDEERAAARASDPDFREADDRFQEKVREVKGRKKRGY